MKKVLSAILALVICLSLCACGVSKEKVEKDLQGTWEYTWYASAVGFYCSSIYEFDDGYFVETFIRDGEIVWVKNGFYIINEDEIEIWLSGEEDPYAILVYAYDDGELTLVDYGDGSVENEYEKID